MPRRGRDRYFMLRTAAYFRRQRGWPSGTAAQGAKLRHGRPIADRRGGLRMDRSSDQDDDSVVPAIRGAVSPAIRQVLDFIERNFADAIACSELAALCGLSLHRFVTVFRSQVGIPPHQYLCRTRVENARCLLRRGPAAGGGGDRYRVLRPEPSFAPLQTSLRHYAGEFRRPRARAGPRPPRPHRPPHPWEPTHAPDRFPRAHLRLLRHPH